MSEVRGATPGPIPGPPRAHAAEPEPPRAATSESEPADGTATVRPDPDALETSAPGTDAPETGDLVIDAALRDLAATPSDDLDAQIERGEQVQRTLQGRLGDLGG